MPTPSNKELKKLVKLCREVGIKSFKGEGFEFTITDEAPVKSVKGKSSVPAHSTTVETDLNFESDTLTESQLLMWSAAGGGVPFPTEEEAQ